MILREYKSLPLVGELKVSIKIVSDESETRTITHSALGHWYRRFRRNTFTQEEFDYRCRTLCKDVCPSCDPGLELLPLLYFKRGYEGKAEGLLGQPSSEKKKESAKRSHAKYREEHLEQMKHYQETKLKKAEDITSV